MWSLKKKRRRSEAKHRSYVDRKVGRTIRLKFEFLEQRALLAGLTPTSVKSVYGITGTGQGQTIAIVDAYDYWTQATATAIGLPLPGYPNSSTGLINYDLDHFDAAQSPSIAAPPGGVKVVYGVSGVKPPNAHDANSTAGPGAAGWAAEEALDVEWAHAIAPQATIYLVEAESDLPADMMTAVQTAENISGVSIISMSWGFLEASDSTTPTSNSQSDPYPRIVSQADEATYDADFKNATGRNVTFLAATGDDGGGAETLWPA